MASGEWIRARGETHRSVHRGEVSSRSCNNLPPLTLLASSDWDFIKSPAHANVPAKWNKKASVSWQRVGWREQRCTPPMTNRQFEESRNDIISFQVQPGGVSQAWQVWWMTPAMEKCCCSRKRFYWEWKKDNINIVDSAVEAGLWCRTFLLSL